MKRIFVTLVAALGLAAAASAEVLERVQDYASLNAVNIMYGSFDVSFVKAEKYSIRIVTDAVLADYVTSTLREGTVYISYDSKSLPKEVKKLYKGRGLNPVMNITIYGPQLQELSLGDKCRFSSEEMIQTDRFNLTLADNASVGILKMRAENVGVVLKKKSSATLTLDVPGSLTISTEGSADARINGTFGAVTSATAGSSTVVIDGSVDDLELRSEGSSQVTVGSRIKSANVEMANSSKVVLTGTATELVINGKNNAATDIRNLAIDEVTLTLNSATVHTGAKKTLNLELTGGASVFYDGEPRFNIVKIVKSTLSPSSAK